MEFRRGFARVGALVVLLALLGCGEAPATGDEAVETDPAQPRVTVTPAPERERPSDEELAELQRGVDQAPDDKRARRRLAVGLFEAGRADEAIAMFEEDARTSPGVASLLNLGRAYDRVLRYEDAESTYRKVLELTSNHPTALHALGNLALVRGDRDEAIDLYRKAVAAKPDYLMAVAHLADALKLGGETEEAYDAYARAVELRPSTLQEMGLYQDAVYNLAAIDLAAGAPDRAVDLLEDLLEARPDHPSANYAYGQALMMLGREEDAQRAFEAHMRVRARLQPKSPAAMGE